MTIEEIRRAISPVLKSHGVKRAGLFGSAARGELRTKSDIDILVDIKKDISLFEFIAIKQELEERLGRTVDLVEYQTIKPALREKILQSQVTLRGHPATRDHGRGGQKTTQRPQKKIS